MLDSSAFYVLVLVFTGGLRVESLLLWPRGRGKRKRRLKTGGGKKNKHERRTRLRLHKVEIAQG